MKRKNSIVLCFNCKLKIALGISLGGNLKDKIPTQHSLFLRVHSAKTIITHTEELHLLLNYIEKSFCESEFSWDLYALIISKVLRMINIWSGGFVLKLVLILLQSFKTYKKLLGKSGQECSFEKDNGWFSPTLDGSITITMQKVHQNISWQKRNFYIWNLNFSKDSNVWDSDVLWLHFQLIEYLNVQ